MDYEKMSDDDLQKEYEKALMNAKPEDLSEAELDQAIMLHKSAKRDEAFRPDMMTAPKWALKAVGTVADYPAGVARSVINEGVDLLNKKKDLSESVRNIGASFLGPANAPTSQDIAEKVGIPNTPIPGTSIPQSAVAGLALDIGTGLGEGSLINKGLGVASRAAKSGLILDADEKALGAIGMDAKTARKAIKSYKTNPDILPSSGVSEIRDYAKENVIKAFDSTEGMLQRATRKLRDVGDRIGLIRQNNMRALDKWLLDKAGTPEVEEYLLNTFNPELEKTRLIKDLRSSIKDPEARRQVQDFVNKRLDALAEEYGKGNAVPVDDLSKLKADWQNEINFGKEAADYSTREAAFNWLQRAADRGIDNELKFGDKYLKGNDLANHTKLKKEYGMLKQMIPGMEAKLARKIVGKENPVNLMKPGTWFENQRMQSAIAKLPDKVNLIGPKTQVAADIGHIVNMMPGGYKEPKLEGFPMSQTMEVNPEEALMYGAEIEKSMLPPVDKARALNLLNKHKRIYLEQLGQ